MNQNKELIILHAKALSKLSQLGICAEQNFPKISLSHQQYLEFVAKAWGFNSYKGAISSTNHPQFNYQVFKAEFTSLVEGHVNYLKSKSDGSEWFSRDSTLKFFFENLLRQGCDLDHPLHNVVANILAHLDFPFERFNEESEKIFEMHVPEHLVSKSNFLEIYLFCHFISTRDKGSNEPLLVKPFKGSRNKISELNQLIEDHLPELFVASEDFSDLYIHHEVGQILDICYTNSEVQFDWNKDYLPMAVSMGLLGHSTEDKEEQLDKESKEIADEYYDDIFSELPIFDKFYDKLRNEFKKLLAMGLYRISPHIFIHPPCPACFRDDILSSLVSVIDFNIRTDLKIADGYSMYLNSSGFLKLISDSYLEEMFMEKMGLDLNDASYVLNVQALRVKYASPSQRKKLPAADRYVNYMMKVLRRMIKERKGLNNPEEVERQISEILNN